MFKRPSTRRRSHSDHQELPLVPVLDTMVTLIGFLLFTSSFLSLVALDTLLPISTTSQVLQKAKEIPLQLTLTLRDHDIEVWSPFNKIEPHSIPHETSGVPDEKGLHDYLLKIKERFPEEEEIIFVPTPTTKYEILIALMDSVRSIESLDQTLFHTNPVTNVKEPIRSLFPKIVYGNLLGG